MKKPIGRYFAFVMISGLLIAMFLLALWSVIVRSPWLQAQVLLLRQQPETWRSAITITLATLIALAGAVLIVLAVWSGTGAVLRAMGKDSAEKYRVYEAQCQGKIEKNGGELQLEVPVFPLDRAKRIELAIEVGIVSLLLFFKITLGQYARTGTLLGGAAKGVLAALGVWVVYLILWVLAAALGNNEMRVRKVRK